MKIKNMIPYAMIIFGNTVLAVYILFNGITPDVTGTLFWTIVIDVGAAAITIKHLDEVIF